MDVAAECHRTRRASGFGSLDGAEGEVKASNRDTLRRLPAGACRSGRLVHRPCAARACPSL